jgi:hypothetical protein
VEEEEDDTDWGDAKPTPLAVPIKPASTASADEPSTTTSTTLVSFKPHVVLIDGRSHGELDPLGTIRLGTHASKDDQRHPQASHAV